jgi:hypothetical protein
VTVAGMTNFWVVRAFALVCGMKGKAGPSTSLRSGRDDNLGVVALVGVGL